jgi:hypothetical protein
LKFVRESSEYSEQREEALRGRLNRITTQQTEQQSAKQRILALYARSRVAIDQRDESCHLDLSSCGLRDEDMPVLAGILLKKTECEDKLEEEQSMPTWRLRHLDLSSNAISDIGAEALARVLGARACRIRTLDLQKNAISADGIRAIAEKLESRCTGETFDEGYLSLQHVFVHQDGKIEVLGSVVSTVESPVVSGVVTVDVRANTTPATAVVPESFVPAEARLKSKTKSKKLLHSSSSSSSSGGGGGGGGGGNSTKKRVSPADAAAAAVYSQKSTDAKLPAIN